jgi:hypothetical protein
MMFFGATIYTVSILAISSRMIYFGGMMFSKSYKNIEISPLAL